MEKIPVSIPHPNLIMGMRSIEASDCIAELLQSLQDLEAQHTETGSHKKLKKDQEQLKKDQAQLKRDQAQLMKFQAFILKLSKQIIDTEAESRKHNEPLLKQGMNSY